MNYDENIKFLKEFCKNHNIPHFNDFIHSYSISYEILSKIDYMNKNLFSDKEFTKLLNNSEFLFSTLNNFDKNRGHLKTSKRINLISNYYAKYKENKKIPTTYKNYFNSITIVNLPSKENIYTILKHMFTMFINEIIKNKKLSNEMAHQLMYDLFNVKKYRSNLRYKEISIKGYIDSLYYNVINYTKQIEEKEKYIFN